MLFIVDLKPKVVQELIDEFGQSFLEGKARSNLLELVTIVEQLSSQLCEFPLVIDHARKIGQLLRDRPRNMVEQVAKLNFELQTTTSRFPPLQEFDFEMATLEFEMAKIESVEESTTPPIQLEPFGYEVATVQVANVQKGWGETGYRESYEKVVVEVIKTPREGRKFVERIGKSIDLEMVYIPSGKFIMGAPESEEASTNEERPQHLVTVPAFFMGRYPITQAQYMAVMEENPSRFKDKADSSRRPVENVTWENAKEFCERLSKKTEREYRLPSEAEWEYVCRAGTTTPISFWRNYLYKGSKL